MALFTGRSLNFPPSATRAQTFLCRQPVGEMTVDGPLRTRLVAFAAEALRALRLRAGVFHMEMIYQEDIDQLHFMEVRPSQTFWIPLLWFTGRS